MEQNYIDELLSLIHSNKSDEELREELQKYHENDVAKIFPQLLNEERQKLYRILEKNVLSDIFSYLENPKEYLDELSNDLAADILESMDSDDAIDVLEELEEKNRNELIELMDEEAVAEIKLIKSYDDDMIGSRMTTNYIAIDKNSTIKQAMKKMIEEAAINDNVSMIYFTDLNNEFYGAMDLRDLIIARENENLQSIIKTSYPYLKATELVSDCINKIQEYALDSIPVVDDCMHLIGVITSDDILEAVSDEFSDDYAKLGGLSSEEDLKEPIFKSVRKRIPWLFILLGLGLVTSLLIAQFENVVAGIPIIVVFQSLILDMAGNCGTQSLAVTIRVLTDEELSNKNIFKMIFKEFRVGLINGIIVGIFTFIFVFIFLLFTAATNELNQNLKIAIVVCMSILFSIVVANFAGSFIPIIFKKCKIDPAVASGPFITTLIDIIAVIIYYGLAWLLILNVL